MRRDLPPTQPPSVVEQVAVADQLVRLLMAGVCADLPSIRWTLREDELLIIGNVQPGTPGGPPRWVWGRWADMAGLGTRTETDARCGWTQLLAVTEGGQPGHPAAVNIVAYIRNDG